MSKKYFNYDTHPNFSAPYSTNNLILLLGEFIYDEYWRARQQWRVSIMKNGCTLSECSHPSVLQHTLCTGATLCPVSPLSPATGRVHVALQSPWWGVTYETLHPRTPHVPDHSACLAKLLLLCSHYPFNFSLLHGVSFLLLRLIQVQSIITPSGIG